MSDLSDPFVFLCEILVASLATQRSLLPKPCKVVPIEEKSCLAISTRPSKASTEKALPLCKMHGQLCLTSTQEKPTGNLRTGVEGDDQNWPKRRVKVSPLHDFSSWRDECRLHHPGHRQHCVQCMWIISRPVRGNKMLARGAGLKDSTCTRQQDAGTWRGTGRQPLLSNCPACKKTIFKIVLVLQKPSGSETLLNLLCC